MHKSEERLLLPIRKIYGRLKKMRKSPYRDAFYQQPLIYNQPILSLQEGNDYIAKLLQSPKPFMVSRFGWTELTCVANYIQVKRMRDSKGLAKYFNFINGDLDSWEDRIKVSMANDSGFFPATEPMLERFSELFMEETRSIDALGVWFNLYEDYLSNKYCPNATLIPFDSIEPYYFDNPWSAHLKGKKVLVLHPFEESIKMQFEKRKLLFKNPNVLPDFDLQVVRAVQTVAGTGKKSPFKDWFEALEHMQGQIAARNFDVAIIAAGAYGLPLASFVKKLGKQVIHMAGATQILFGIKGKRWDDRPKVNVHYNEHWVRPLPTEVPQNHQVADKGSYW